MRSEAIDRASRRLDRRTVRAFKRRGGPAAPWKPLSAASLLAVDACPRDGGREGSILCTLFGTTTPFDAATLGSLYPSHRAFVAAYGKSARRSVRAGFLLKPDAKLITRWAAASDIGQ